MFGRRTPHARRSGELQRFFSTFPGSWPGAGLLLLRAVVSGAAVLQGGLYLSRVAEPTAETWALGLLAIGSGMTLVAGFLTPGSGVVAGLTTVVIVVTWTPPSPAPSLLLDRVAAFFVLADATALALLGPGAHSMDAHLFGRREIIIPHQSRRR